MDRFIGVTSYPSISSLTPFKIQYRQIYSAHRRYTERPFLRLKSNMDRFIVQNRNQSMFCIIGLKSNMDRFIAKVFLNISKSERFKIQYGQIYRLKSIKLEVVATEFKIQYGQIYREFSDLE